MSSYKFTQRAVASPDAPQQPLVRKRARFGPANWVQVSRMVAPSPAKKPRTGGSQQPACDHEEHQILSASEAAAFAAQFWDKKTHPTKASEYEFLATCIDVDLEQKYTRKRGHQTRYFVPYRGSHREICKNQFLHYFSTSVYNSLCKTVTTYPPPNPYISETAFSRRFQKATYPPLWNEILVHWTKT